MSLSLGTDVRKIALFLALLGCQAIAQNTVGDVTLQIFAKPEAGEFHLLIRLPLAALNGANTPTNLSGQLDLTRTADMLPSVARRWIADKIDILAGTTPLPKPRVTAARISLPSDDAFSSYDSAWAHVHSAGLPGETQLFRDQAMLDILLDYDLRVGDADFGLRSRLADLAGHVTTELDYLPAGRALRHFDYTGDPGLFYFDPSLSQAFLRFLSTGFGRAITGTDWLLFMFCVGLQLVAIRVLGSFLAAFAGASFISLLAAVNGLVIEALWFPLFVETLIAAGILYMAFETMAGGQLVRRKWIPALGFGLLFGQSFAPAYIEARQFAGAHSAASALFFALGIQLGVWISAAVAALTLWLIFRATRRISRRTETIVLSVLVADLAWHRVTDRAERLSQFRIQWPVFDLAQGMLWFAIVLLAAGAVFIVMALRRQTQKKKGPAHELGEPATSSKSE